jgi:hypothetical protein
VFILRDRRLENSSKFGAICFSGTQPALDFSLSPFSTYLFFTIFPFCGAVVVVFEDLTSKIRLNFHVAAGIGCKLALSVRVVRYVCWILV